MKIVCYFHSNKPANLCQYGKGFAENFVYTEKPFLRAETFKDQIIAVVSVVEGPVHAADGGG